MTHTEQGYSVFDPEYPEFQAFHLRPTKRNLKRFWQPNATLRPR